MESKWLLDSGCGCHVTGDKEMFTKIRQYRGKQTARTPDGAEHGIAGQGDVAINLPSGRILALRNVCYVPGLKMNLISVAKITDDGMWVLFGPRDAKVISPQHSLTKPIAQARRIRGTYVLVTERTTPPRINSIQSRQSQTPRFSFLSLFSRA